MRHFIVALAILFGALPACAGEAVSLPMPPQYDVSDGRVLVPGTPSLEVGVYHCLLNSIEAAWTIALTDAEQEQVRVALMQDCLDQRPALFAELGTLREIWQRAATEKKAGVIARLLRDALEQWMKRAPAGRVATVMRDIAKNSLETVVPGQPAVTRRCVQAFAEIVRFAFVLRDARVPSSGVEQDKQFEIRVTAMAPKLSPAGRQWLANADYHRHLMRRGWREIEASEKDAVKQHIIAAFSPAGAASAAEFDPGQVELPPPNFFPLPRDLPSKLR